MRPAEHLSNGAITLRCLLAWLEQVTVNDRGSRSFSSFLAPVPEGDLGLVERVAERSRKAARVKCKIQGSWDSSARLC